MSNPGHSKVEELYLFWLGAKKIRMDPRRIHPVCRRARSPPSRDRKQIRCRDAVCGGAVRTRTSALTMSTVATTAEFATPSFAPAPARVVRRAAIAVAWSSALRGAWSRRPCACRGRRCPCPPLAAFLPVSDAAPSAGERVEPDAAAAPFPIAAAARFAARHICPQFQMRKRLLFAGFSFRLPECVGG